MNIFFFTKNTTAFICAAAVSYSSVALATQTFADNDVGSGTDTTYFEEVIVSANLHKQTLLQTNASVSLLSMDDIARLQPQDFSALMEQQVGFDVLRSGGRTSTSSLLLRGTNSDHTLILVNGQRIRSATSGTTPFQLINPDQIARMEIVRGSRSSLYGSDAIGGVVDISTYADITERQVKLTAEGASHDKQRIAGLYADQFGKGYISISGENERSDGIDNSVDVTGNNADDDASDVSSINIFAGYDVNAAWTLTASHMQLRGKSDYDNLFNNAENPYSIATNRATSMAVKFSPSMDFVSELSLGQAADKSEQRDYDLDGLGSLYATERDSLYWLNQWQVVPSLLMVGGIDYVAERVDVTQNKARQDYIDSNGKVIDSRYNSALFLQAEYRLGVFDISYGSRHDDNSSYGDVVTDAMSAGVTLAENLRFYVNRSEGFKAPSFNDLYFPLSYGSMGNANLKPEISTSYEDGIKYQADVGYVQVAHFYTEITNLISWQCNELWECSPQNVAGAELSGFELSAGGELFNTTVDASFSYTDARDADSGAPLDYRAKRKLVVDVAHAIGPWQFGGSLKLQSERFVGAQTLAGYGTLAMHARYRVDDHFNITLKANNLTDKTYQLNPQYREDGRNFSLQITYQL